MIAVQEAMMIRFRMEELAACVRSLSKALVAINQFWSEAVCNDA